MLKKLPEAPEYVVTPAKAGVHAAIRLFVSVVS